MKILFFIDEFWDHGYTNLPAHTLIQYDTNTDKYEIIEYNLDTSAGHPVKDDDIVRYSSEKKRVKDKEP